MTRFARAKGSKSSNSRVVEEATNWSEFQQQIKQKKSESSSNTGSIGESALKRIKQGGQTQTNTDWADFGVPPVQGNSPHKKLKKRKKGDHTEEEVEASKNKKTKPLVQSEEKSVSNQPEAQSDISADSKSKKKKKRKRAEEDEHHQGQNISEESSIPTSVPQFKRRKPFVASSTININGITISVSKFDGFDVKTDDAIRLKELRSKMLKEGIPRAEVDKAMKLERRKAEKALAREKKKVCFNCRKAGHMLSECPEVGSFGSKNFDSSAVNLCYKCGSTEHTHFQCQVKKKKEYSFATCFICKEQGHISSQCPDNPRGLYPQGGCCKVCGEVTHLKKDCPQLAKDRTENTVTLDTFASNSKLESLGNDVDTSQKVKKTVVNQNKIIKF